MNNTERDEKIATLEGRMRRMRQRALEVKDEGYKEHLFAYANGIEEALTYFRPGSR